MDCILPKEFDAKVDQRLLESDVPRNMSSISILRVLEDKDFETKGLNFPKQRSGKMHISSTPVFRKTNSKAMVEEFINIWTTT